MTTETTNTETISYTYLDDEFVERSATFVGDPGGAIVAAIDFLGAVPLDEGGPWAYIAPEAGVRSIYCAEREDLIVLGAGLLDSQDTYSLWCAGHGWEADDDEARTLALAAAAAGDETTRQAARRHLEGSA